MEKSPLTAKRVFELVKKLNDSSPQARHAAWQDLRQHLRQLPAEGSTRLEAWTKLRDELVKKADQDTEWIKWIGPLKTSAKEWITSQATTEAKIGVLRIVANLGATDREIWHDTLLPIVKETSAEVDLRAWALYTLRWAQLRVTDSNWDEIGEPLVEEALKDAQAKVRQWAAYVLGEMSRRDRTSQEELTRTRVAGHVQREKVEQALIDQWDCEIDSYVGRSLILALEHAGGCIRGSGSDPWPAVRVLAEAADPEHYSMGTYSLVPGAVEGIAEAVTSSPGIPPDEKVHALQGMMQALGIWFDKPDLGYETYRSGIKAVAALTPQALRRAPGQELTGKQLLAAREGLDLLLKAAESKSIRGRGGEENGPDRVRGRSVREIKYMAESAEEGQLRHLLEERVAPRLQVMLADPSPTVAREVTDALTAILGQEQAGNHFVDIILEDNAARAAAQYRAEHWQDVEASEAIEKLVRTRAAEAVRLIEKNQKALERLADKLKAGEGRAFERARDALEAMGGQKAIGALVEAEKRRWVESKFFTPMDKADEHGREILNRTVKKSDTSFTFTLWAAVTVGLIGATLAISTIVLMWRDQTISNLNATVMAVSGVVALIVSLLVPFFWNPAAAVQKTHAEMTKLVTAFHSYMGRMRLLGLGFAHAYTENEWEKSPRFLTTVSDAAGDAMLDSTGVLSDISFWPGAKVTVQVPDVTGMKWDEAQKAAEARGLTVTLKESAYDEEVPEDRIAAQSPAAESRAEVGTSIQLTLSKGPKPEGLARTVQVPDFAKMTWEEAKTKAAAEGIHVDYARSESSATVPKDHVVSQDPVAGKIVNTGDTVSLVLSDGPPPAGQKVPDLTGKTWAEAETLAATAKLGLILDGQQHHATLAEGSIIDQEPKAQALLAEGSNIKAVVSKGPSPGQTVPDLAGKTWAEAETLAATAKLGLGLERQQHQATLAEGSIVDQEPRAKALLAEGSDIKAIVSKGPSPGQTVPDLIGKSWAEAEKLAATGKLDLVLDGQQHHATIPEGSIIAQNPRHKTLAAEGSDIMVVVSKGPEG
jgi:beta-lactam-binding protein with PASTA domain